MGESRGGQRKHGEQGVEKGGGCRFCVGGQRFYGQVGWRLDFFILETTHELQEWHVGGY